MNRTDLGQRLFDARTAKGWSLNDAAAATERCAGYRVGPQRIYAIEIGRSSQPRREALQALATAYEQPFDELALLAYGADGPTPPTSPPEESEPRAPSESGRQPRTASAST